MNYDEMYTDCVDNWKLVNTRKVEIKGLSCEAEHFFSEENHKQGKNSNLTFFSVDGVIIGVAFEYCENISIFGEDWF